MKKNFTSYRDQLLYLAKVYGIVEIKSYAHAKKRLSTAQLEVILLKNRIKLPLNRLNSKLIARLELREKSITNMWLSLFFVCSFIFGGLALVLILLSYNRLVPFNNRNNQEENDDFEIEVTRL